MKFVITYADIQALNFMLEISFFIQKWLKSHSKQTDVKGADQSCMVIGVVFEKLFLVEYLYPGLIFLIAIAE